jgi:tripartite-type tricarboxylate transporter receptor subunit TctC
LGGQVDVAFGNVGDIAAKIKGNPLRVLMIMDPQRSKFMPDVPTTAELGFPKIISSSTRGMFGPAGIPEPILKKIQAVFSEAMKDPDHMDKMDKSGLAVRSLVGEEYKKYAYDLHQRIAPLMEIARKSK